MPVVVEVGSEASAPVQLTLGRLPLVSGVEPQSAQPGDRVALNGKGFDPATPGNRVYLGGQRTLVISATPTRIEIVAPGGRGSGGQVALPVVVEAGGRTSAASATFTLLRPSSSTYVPRFYAAIEPDHPDHDHALVAIDPGPVLVLTGKADAASTAERAARAAAALNAALEGPGAATLALEVREHQGNAAVAVSGAAEALVTATPDDAAGYAETWEAGARSARLTPRNVATYWAALLQDLVSLFVARQRPYRLLELSARGKVLLDIYSDAVRRVGPGNGVPTSLVTPLPSALAKGLRDAAVLLPAPGQATAAAAVTGRWEGTMDEPGFGPRRIEVRLRLVSGRLEGTLSARTGKISMELPLRDLSYDKGGLRFVVTSHGAPRRFAGTVEGTTINGSISGERSEELGRFSLRYAE
jgi:hypothetical protein